MLKRASRSAAAVTNRNPTAQPSRPSGSRPHWNASIAGAMPNEMMSASESSCTPNSLVVPVMRAMRPSSMSSTMATPMNGAAVVELAAHRVDDARPAAEHVGQREQAGQQRDAAPQPAPLDGRHG